MFCFFKCGFIEKSILLAMVFLFPCLPLAQIQNISPVILAAANVRLPLEEIAGNFERSTKIKPKIIYGSSSNFYQQILNGGKFDLFLSADESLIDQLQVKKNNRLETTVYAKGKLVVWVSNRAFSEGMNLDVIQHSLESSKTHRIAIANPSLAPYGKASEQALRKWKVWEEIQKKLIMGENVGQVAQFALSGSVEVAFLPVSLTMPAEMQKNGYVVNLSDELYSPIIQKMALLSDQAGAKDFYQFILDKQNKWIWEKYGYAVP
jgi:molybdate transport system substrate-binding protein